MSNRRRLLTSPTLPLVAALVAVACGASQSDPAPPLRPATIATDSAPAMTSPSREPRVDQDPDSMNACAAPSVLRLHGADDARDAAALDRCSRGDAWAVVPDREQGPSQRCDLAGRKVTLARALEGALPLDAATRDHVRRIFADGKERGRRADAFGLVGDSITVDGSFMRPFAAGSSARLALPRDVLSAISLGGASPARDVIDLFRHARTGEDGKLAADSFVAPRAAKIGVRATWPLASPGFGGKSPLDVMIGAVSPAYAVILYGANDALWRTDDVDALVHDYDAHIAAIVDALEARGIIPILTTVPKHEREANWPDCPLTPTSGSNERFAIQATALSADVAQIACTRHLPLVDLRWALDPLVNHGVGPDGVHLSKHPSGGGLLDAGGLQCGYNVRNLVTLRELALVVQAVGQ
jgi:hypothetical protein